MEDKNKRIKYQTGGDKPPTETNPNDTLTPQTEKPQPYFVPDHVNMPFASHEYMDFDQLMKHRSNVISSKYDPNKSSIPLGQGYKFNLPEEKDFSEYVEEDVPIVGGTDYSKELDRARYQNQSSFMGNTWAAIANTVVGGVFGIVETGVQITEDMVSPFLPTFGQDIDYDYTNGVLQWLEESKKSVKEGAYGGQIYTNPDGTMMGGLGSYAAWANTVGSIGESAVSFVIPGAALGKGIQGVVGIANAAVKGSKAAGATAVGIGKWANAAAHVATAGALASVEGKMTGGQVYKETYDQLLRGGMDQVEAAKRAQMGASAAARISTVINTALNMTGLKSVFRNADDIYKGLAKKTEKEFLKQVDDATIKAGYKKGQAGYTDEFLKQARAIDPAKVKGAAFSGRDMWKMSGWEALQEMGEEGVTFMAESAGKRIALDNKREPYIASFADIGNFLYNMTYMRPQELATEQGIITMAMGAYGGIGQNVLMESIPFHKMNNRTMTEAHRTNTDGSISTIEAGTDVLDAEGKPTKRRVSARELEDTNRQIAFNRYKAVLLHDMKAVSDLEHQIQDVAADTTLSAGAKEAKIADLQDKLFSTETLRSIRNNTASNLKASYEFIANLDNDTLLSDKFAEHIAVLEKSKANSTNETEIAKIDANIAYYTKLMKEAGNTMTDAMARGFATEKGKTDYKDKAKQAIKDIEEYEKLAQELNDKHNYGDGESQDHVRALFNIKVENKRRGKEIEKYQKALDDAIAREKTTIISLKEGVDDIAEAALIQAEIEAKADAYNEELKRFQELLKSEPIKVINELKTKYPELYRSLIADKKTPHDMAIALVNKYAEDLNALKTETDKLIPELLAKKEAVVQRILDNKLISGNWLVDESLTEHNAASLKEFKKSVDGKVNEMEGRIVDHVKDLEKAKLDLATNEKAYNELTSTKGRNGFVKASNKYWKAYFAELKKVEEERLKEKEAADKAKAEAAKKAAEAKTAATGAAGTSSTNTNGDVSPDDENEDQFKIRSYDFPDKSVLKYGGQLANQKGLIDHYFTLKDFMRELRLANLIQGTNYSKDRQELLEHMISVYGNDVVIEVKAGASKPYKDRAAEYDPATNKITLYTSMMYSFEYLAETIMHELIHHQFKKVTDIGGQKPKLEAELSLYLQDLAEIISGHKLGNEDALKAILNKLNDEIASSKGEAANKLKVVYNSLKKVLETYPTSGLEELVTYGLSNKHFAQWLHSIDATASTGVAKTSMWTRLRDLILSIIGVTDTKRGSFYTRLVDIMDSTANVVSTNLVFSVGQKIVTPGDAKAQYEIASITKDAVGNDMITLEDMSTGTLLTSIPRYEMESSMIYETLAFQQFRLALGYLNNASAMHKQKQDKVAKSELDAVKAILAADEVESSDNQMTLYQRNIVESLMKTIDKAAVSNDMTIAAIIGEIKAKTIEEEIGNEMIIEKIKDLPSLEEVNAVVKELTNQKLFLNAKGIKALHDKAAEFFNKINDESDFKKKLNVAADIFGNSDSMNIMGMAGMIFKSKFNKGDDLVQLSRFDLMAESFSLNETATWSSITGFDYKLHGNKLWKRTNNEDGSVTLTDALATKNPVSLVLTSDEALRFVYEVNRNNTNGGLAERLYKPDFISGMYFHKLDSALFEFKLEEAFKTIKETIEQYDDIKELEDFKIQELKAVVDSMFKATANISKDVYNKITKSVNDFLSTVDAIKRDAIAGILTKDQAIETLEKYKTDLKTALNEAFSMKGASRIRTTMQDILMGNVAKLRTVFMNKDAKKAFYLSDKGAFMRNTVHSLEEMEALTFEQFMAANIRITLTTEFAVNINKDTEAGLGTEVSAANEISVGLIQANVNKQTNEDASEFIGIHRWMDIDPLVEVVNMNDDVKTLQFQAVGWVNNPNKYVLVDKKTINDVGVRAPIFTPIELLSDYESAIASGDNVAAEEVLKRFERLFAFNPSNKKTVDLLRESAEAFENNRKTWNFMTRVFEANKNKHGQERNISVNGLAMPFTMKMTGGSFNWGTGNFLLSNLLSNNAYAYNERGQYGILKVDAVGGRTAILVDKNGKIDTVNVIDVDAALNEAYDKIPDGTRKMTYVIMKDAAGDIRLVETVARDLDMTVEDTVIGGVSKTVINDPVLKAFSEELVSAAKAFVKALNDPANKLDLLTVHNMSDALNNDKNIKKVFVKTAPKDNSTINVDFQLNYAQEEDVNKASDPKALLESFSTHPIKVKFKITDNTDGSVKVDYETFTIKELENPNKILEKLNAKFPGHSIKFGISSDKKTLFDIKDWKIKVNPGAPFKSGTIKIKFDEGRDVKVEDLVGNAKKTGDSDTAVDDIEARVGKKYTSINDDSFSFTISGLSKSKLTYNLDPNSNLIDGKISKGNIITVARLEKLLETGVIEELIADEEWDNGFSEDEEKEYLNDLLVPSGVFTIDENSSGFKNGKSLVDTYKDAYPEVLFELIRYAYFGETKSNITRKLNAKFPDADIDEKDVNSIRQYLNIPSARTKGSASVVMSQDEQAILEMFEKWKAHIDSINDKHDSEFNEDESDDTPLDSSEIQAIQWHELANATDKQTALVDMFNSIADTNKKESIYDYMIDMGVIVPGADLDQYLNDTDTYTYEDMFDSFNDPTHIEELNRILNDETKASQSIMTRWIDDKSLKKANNKQCF